IVCLQECRILPTIGWDDTEQLRRAAYPYKINDRRGIIGRDAGILVDTDLFDLVPGSTRQGDRWLYVHLRARRLLLAHAPHIRDVHVWSIHGPFHERFWVEDGPGLLNLPYDTLHSALNVIGADWNSVPDPFLDSLLSRKEAVRWQVIQPLLRHLGLYDAARALHPDELLASRIRSITVGPGRDKQTSARRIDSVWISASAQPAVTGYISAVTTSNHDAVGLQFGLSRTAPQPPSRASLAFASDCPPSCGIPAAAGLF
ncbi:hypothetical protein V8E36_003102, partial [Tilletia maclaganii]